MTLKLHAVIFHTPTIITIPCFNIELAHNYLNKFRQYFVSDYSLISTCTHVTEEAQSTVILGISLGVILLLMIPLLILGAIAWYLLWRTKQRANKVKNLIGETEMEEVEEADHEHAEEPEAKEVETTHEEMEEVEKEVEKEIVPEERPAEKAPPEATGSEEVDVVVEEASGPIDEGLETA